MVITIIIRTMCNMIILGIIITNVIVIVISALIIFVIT